ncbi:MAG: phosphoglycerate mutase family protein [Acidobacteriota bacterium]
MTFLKLKNRLLFYMLITLLLLSFTPSPISADEPVKITTVYLVRHAEKQVVSSGQQMMSANDPPLTDEGKARARNLARMLGKADIKTIITSQYLRTKQTAEPLAESLNLTAIVLPISAAPADRNKVSEQSIKNIVEKIYQSGGESVLVVGHTNTLPEVIKMLGGGTIAEIPETDYDNLFIVTVLGKGKAKIARMRF